MKILVVDEYTEDFVRSHPEWLFVYGDNQARFGKKGQAIIRDAHNTFGVATKKWPSMKEECFFRDGNADLEIVKEDMANLWSVRDHWDYLVFPRGGLGTGLSKMPEKCPVIFRWLCQVLKEHFYFVNYSGELEISEASDGINHINIYSKGITDLGRMWSNFAHTPFCIEPYGEFASVEALWYYAKTGFKHDELRGLYGYKAKEEGNKYSVVPLESKESFNAIIKKALECKWDQTPHLRELALDNHLPYKHYYVFKGHEKFVPQYDWIVDKIEEIVNGRN